MISLFRLGNRRRCGFGEGWLRSLIETDAVRRDLATVGALYPGPGGGKLEVVRRRFEVFARVDGGGGATAAGKGRSRKAIEAECGRFGTYEYDGLYCRGVYSHALFAAMVECQLQLSLNR